jgi:hypothetical protein
MDSLPTVVPDGMNILAALLEMLNSQLARLILMFE